ncbi:unnamed protein product [Urochloa humidicola]
MISGNMTGVARSTGPSSKNLGGHPRRPHAHTRMRLPRSLGCTYRALLGPLWGFSPCDTSVESGTRTLAGSLPARSATTGPTARSLLCSFVRVLCTLRQVRPFAPELLPHGNPQLQRVRPALSAVSMGQGSGVPGEEERARGSRVEKTTLNYRRFVMPRKGSSQAHASIIQLYVLLQIGEQCSNLIIIKKKQYDV